MDYATIRNTLAGRPKPAGISNTIWQRIQKVATDARLASINPDLLPTSHTALYDLTRLRTDVIRILVDIGAMRPDLSCGEIRRIRATGRVSVRIDVDTGEAIKVLGTVKSLKGVVADF